MGHYLQPLAAARENIVIAADGSVWANYLLTGIQVSPYDSSTFLIAQEQNLQLLNALSRMATDDVYLGGIKVRIAPEERVQSITHGLKKIAAEQYPALSRRVNKFYDDLRYGKYFECERRYFLSIKIPTDMGSEAKALTRAGVLGAVNNVDWQRLHRVQQQYFNELPPAFAPQPATPAHLTWVHERMRQRGLDVPVMPAAQTAFNPTGFSSVAINKLADSDVLFNEFVDNTANGMTPQVKEGRLAQWRRNYRSARWATMVAVHSPELRSDTLPDGPAAMQSLIAVCGYPHTPKAMLNTFTYLVDQDLGSDADFALRMHFDQRDISVEQHREYEATLGYESDDNSVDRHDARDYQDRANEREQLSRQARSEPAARGIAVSALFALAHPNRQVLKQSVDAFREKLESHDFTTMIPVGGQFDLLKQMLPCVATSDLVNELKGGTTVRKFSACMPVRRTVVGDEVGIPIAINKENALGQIVLLDLLGSTKLGSGSLAATGAQGGGKSYLLKTLIDWLGAMKRPMTIFDQSASREYLVFAASQGGRVQSIDVAKPRVSLDPLKVFAADPQMGKTVFMEAAQVLFGSAPDSDEMLLLSQMLEPKTRQNYGIHASRDLVRVLRQGKFADDRGKDTLQRKLSMWAGLPYTSALFDPIDHAARVTELPAYRRSADADQVVYLTYGLPVGKGDIDKHTTQLELYSIVIHTIIAWITLQEFAQIPGLCGLAADEVSFWKDSAVLKRLLGEPDRTGRKEQNVVFAGGQLPKHFDDDSYDLIRKKIVFRQETRTNAAAAFEWADFPPTDMLVNRLIGLSAKGETARGQGYYNDGFSGKAFVQFLPMADAAARRFSDTTAGNMVRWQDIDPPAAPTAAHPADGARPAPSSASVADGPAVVRSVAPGRHTASVATH